MSVDDVMRRLLSQRDAALERVRELEAERHDREIRVDDRAARLEEAESRTTRQAERAREAERELSALQAVLTDPTPEMIEAGAYSHIARTLGLPRRVVAEVLAAALAAVPKADRSECIEAATKHRAALRAALSAVPTEHDGQPNPQEDRGTYLHAAASVMIHKGLGRIASDGHTLKEAKTWGVGSVLWATHLDEIRAEERR